MQLDEQYFVLVIDDDEVYRQSVIADLRHRGRRDYGVVIFVEGLRNEDEFQHWLSVGGDDVPDLVLVDVDLWADEDVRPHRRDTGLQEVIPYIQILRSTDPAWKGARLIAFTNQYTGAELAEVRRQATLAAVDEFISKEGKLASGELCRIVVEQLRQTGR